MSHADQQIPARLQDSTKRALVGLAEVAIRNKRLVEILADFAAIPDEELSASVQELFGQIHEASEAFSERLEERARQLATFTADVERLKLELLRRGARYQEQ